MARDPDGSFRHLKSNVDGHPMLNMLGYLRSYRLRIGVGLVTSLAMRLLQLAPAVLVATAIDRVVATGGEPGVLARLGLLPATRIPEGDVVLRTAALQRLVVLAVVSYALLSVLQFVSRYLFHTVAQNVQHDLRHDTYEHLQSLSLDFHHDHNTGAMMAVLNNDINRLEAFFNTELRELVRAAALVVVIAAVMFTVDPVLAAVALGPMPLITLATARFMRWIWPTYQQIREDVARLNTDLANNLNGIDVIKSFDRYAVELERITRQSAAYRDAKIHVLRKRKLFFSSLRLVIGAVFAAILWLGGGQVIGGSMSVGTFTLFFMFLRRLDGPMERVGKTANEWQKTRSSAERVFGLLGHEPAIHSAPAADVADGDALGGAVLDGSDAPGGREVAATATDGHEPGERPHAPAEVAGDVAFEDVTFAYGDGDDPDVADVSLSIAAGDTVGLAGPSGAGKSTLLKLVSRFHDVDEGRVTVDGVDVRDYDVQALRRCISVVEQSPYLFSGTVAENLAYGDRALYRTVSEAVREDRPFPEDAAARIREAAVAAGAHQFVTELPDGYRSPVGERGGKLSGGQRQRVSIARALLNDPDVIVFDEATSAVDTETEAVIQENIRELCADRTALVVAHRLSTIRDADEIVVMEDGRVTETGTHDDLCARDDGTYARLWATQADDSGGRPATPAD